MTSWFWRSRNRMVRSSGRSNLEVGELAGAPSTVSCLLLAAGAQKYRPLRPSASALTSPLPSPSTTGPLETAVIDSILGCFCHPPTRVQSVSSSAILLDETFLLTNRRLRILMRPLCFKILDFSIQKWEASVRPGLNSGNARVSKLIHFSLSSFVIPNGSSTGPILYLSYPKPCHQFHSVGQNYRSALLH